MQEEAMKAEYTLQQAIALVNLNAELLHRHLTKRETEKLVQDLSIQTE